MDSIHISMEQQSGSLERGSLPMPDQDLQSKQATNNHCVNGSVFEESQCDMKCYKVAAETNNYS